MLVSETSGPVSSRTRSNEKRVGGDREASNGDDRRGDDDATATRTGRNAGATQTLATAYQRYSIAR